jgi:hypothetical protein
MFFFIVPVTTTVIFILSVLLFAALGAFAGSAFQKRMRRGRQNNNSQQQPNGEHNNTTTENRQIIQADGCYLNPLHEPQIESNLKMTTSQQRQKQRKTDTENDQLHVTNDGYENTQRMHFITLNEYRYITDSSTNANQQTQQTDGGYELPLQVYHNAVDDDHPYDRASALNENQYDEI